MHYRAFVCAVLYFGAVWGVSPTALSQSNLPDLSISEARLVTTSPVPGLPVEVDVSVHRTGSCADCGSAGLTYWDDSGDGSVDCADGMGLKVPADLASQTDTVVRVSLKGYPRPGTYEAWFWINCTEKVTESDTTNNKHSLVILVEAPVTPEPPTDPPDDGSDQGQDGDQGDDPRPPFCGWFGGQSALTASAAPMLTLLGLAGLKYRVRPRRSRLKTER